VGKPSQDAKLENHPLLRRAGVRKRPYIRRQWCQDVIAAPIRREVQGDGRIRFWGKIPVSGEARPRYLRVVTLDDGETVHNAFFDRNFREAPR
jgi:hypothetical protein